MKLRDFGLDLKKIKKVKEFLEIHAAENNPSDYPELDFYILTASRHSDPVKLLVFDSGEALLGNQMEIDYSNHFQTMRGSGNRYFFIYGNIEGMRIKCQLI